MPAAIEIRGLRKSYRVYQKREGLAASFFSLFEREYRTVEAVKGIDLSVEEGEFVAFLGPNGAGKTTTLKLLSGVISPTEGEAKVLGFTPWERKNAYRRRFALVMGQKNQLWWDLPAYESFRLHQQIYQIPTGRFDGTLEMLTDLLGVRSLLKQPVRELSLGERMKMELMAALLHSPEVLFLDEPTIGLDVVSQRRVQEFLRYYQQERKITVVLTSHYMKDVEALCKRAIIINGGLVKHDGPLENILDRFSKHKIIDLQFGGTEVPADLEKYGTVLETTPPRVKLQVPRKQIPEILTGLLAQYNIEDVGVQERPLEEVIAELFTNDKAAMQSEEESTDPEQVTHS